MVAHVWLLNFLYLFSGRPSSFTAFTPIHCFIPLSIKATVITTLCVTSRVVLVAIAFRLHDSVLFLSVDIAEGFGTFVMANDFFYHHDTCK